MDRLTVATAGTPGCAALREAHRADALARIPESLARIKWPADQIRQEREVRLRDLLQVVQERSPWHRERLGSIEVDNFREEELATLSTMTKADLMADFDRIVTDHRLTLDLVNEHISSLTEDAYLSDEYHAIASGGSSGQWGVFVYDREAWTECFLTYRSQILAFLDPELRSGANAHIAAHHAFHQTSALSQTFVPAADRLPVSMPLAEIVDGLNQLQPTRLSTDPSILSALAREAHAGRLRIAPRWVQTAGEPLFPEIRDAAWEA